MPRAEFTYEVRRGPQDPIGVEDYVVRTSDGDAVGTVGALLDRGGERLLVVELGTPPIRHDRRAVRWECVERVDHDAVAVWLTLDAASFEGTALELDPDRAVEEGEGDVEARRVSEPPRDLIPPPQGAPQAGPVENVRWLEALGAFLAMAFASLAATMVVYFTGDSTWALLFLVPAALAVAAGVLAYRAYRSPYEPRGARKP
jgi:hypothetical protein